MNERHHQKHLQVNQTSGTGAPSPAPHPIAPLAGPGQAFPRPVPCRFPRRSGKRQERRKGSRRAAVLEGLSYLEASGEESEDDLWFRRGGRRERGPQRWAGGGTGTCGGRSGQRQGARGDGCPARRPSGSAAAAPLGLTAGPEPQRSGGGGGLTILPRGPVPSNRHRPRCGSAGGSSLTFPAGGASACCPYPAAAATMRGGGKGEKKTGSAAATGGEGRRRGSRWGWSCRCQSRRSVPAVGPRQCPFLSPIINITGQLSPWHTRNRNFWPK